MLTNYCKFRGGPPRQSGGWSTCPVRRGWENGACSAWRWDGFGGLQRHLSVPTGKAAKMTEPGSLLRCTQDNEWWWPWTESGEVLTWYAVGGCCCEDYLNTGLGYPERLWNVCPSNLVWIRYQFCFQWEVALKVSWGLFQPARSFPLAARDQNWNP